MIRKYLIPVLSVTGIVFALIMLKVSGKPVPAAQPVAEPAQTPFRTSISWRNGRQVGAPIEL